MVWSLLLVVVVALFYVNQIGLPDQVKRRVVEQLKQQGWDLEFSRLRWRWNRGIVAEDVHLQKWETGGGPCVFLSEARCLIDHRALLDGSLKVNGLVLEEGRLFWVFNSTNLPSRTFQLDAVAGELWFHADDRWELRQLTAQGLGARFLFNGEVRNATAMRHWDLSRLPERHPPWSMEDRVRQWHQVFETARQIRLAGVPEFSCDFDGDAMDPFTFQGRFNLQTPELTSPWASGTNVSLVLQLYPRQKGLDPVQVELNAGADHVDSPWGQADSVKVYLNGEPSFERWMPTNLHGAMEIHGGRTRWGRAEFAVVMARSVSHPTNSLARLSECTLQVENLSTPQGDVEQGEVVASLSHPDRALFPARWNADARFQSVASRWGGAQTVSLGGQGRLETNFRAQPMSATWPEGWRSFMADLKVGVTNGLARDLPLSEVGLHVVWDPPHLQLEVRGNLARGRLDMEASLDTESRLVSFKADSKLDPGGIRTLLTTNAQTWLERYEWESPPHVVAEGSLRLPPWTGNRMDWRSDIRPTVALRGRLNIGAGSYRDVDFLSAQSDFEMRDERWRLHGLKVRREEGSLEGEYTSLLTTRDFHWDVRAHLYPRAVRPLLPTEKQRRIFDRIRCNEPPDIQALVWGNWQQKNDIAFDARIQATNILIRGESVTGLVARVVLTNRLIHVYSPQVRRTGRETASADGLMIHLEERKLYLTNAIGYVRVKPVSHMISSNAARILAPFQLEDPVNAHVHGIIDLMPKRKEYDLRFDVSGSSLKWKVFDVGRFTSRLVWANNSLLMTNAAAQFHSGQALGHAWFDFAAPDGSDFLFETRVTNVNFNAMTEAISGKTNHLEGSLSGTLNVTQANTADWNSWQGYGEVLLQDGLIWDIPVVGMFSQVFNAVVPGLGNSRARHAIATYVITNSIIHTDDLEISATAMRMQFEGRSDFKKNIHGRMEAELLRDTPAVGMVLSRVFWPMTKLFEYRITGTLQEPEREPLYIVPKILLLPFNPVKGFREIFQPQKE